MKIFLFTRMLCWEKSAWGKGSNPHLTCLSACCVPPPKTDGTDFSLSFYMVSQFSSWPFLGTSTHETFYFRRSSSTLWKEIYDDLMETLGIVPFMAVGNHMITCVDFKKRIDFDFFTAPPQELVWEFENMTKSQKKKSNASSVKTCKPMKSKAKNSIPMKSKPKKSKPMKSKAGAKKAQLKKPAAAKKQHKGKK